MPVPLQLATARCCPSVFYGWYVVLLVGFGMSCAAPGHSFFFLNFVNSFIEDVEIPRTTVASLWSTCLVCAAATAPIGGNIIDRVGPRRVLIFATPPFIAAVFAMGRVQSAPQLFGAIFAVRALGPGWICIAFNKVFNGWWDKKRGRAAAVLGLFHQLALLFVPGTRALIDGVGWRAAFAWSAALIAATLLIVLPNIRDRAELVGLRPDGVGIGNGLAAISTQARDPPAVKLPSCRHAFCNACRTPFFPVYLVTSTTMDVAWGAM